MPETASDYVQKLVEFLLYLSQIRQKFNYQFIYAADKTAVWLDPSGGKCIDELGAGEVSVLSSGHDKALVTVMLTSRSDGRKCKPFVLLSRKRPEPKIVDKYMNKLELCWKGTV